MLTEKEIFEQDCVDIVRRARKSFNCGKSRPYEFRKQQLKNLLRLCTECRDKLSSALKADLRKSHFEACVTEIDLSAVAIANAISNLREWMEPYKPPKTLLTLLDKTVVINDPRRVVLIIGAWNYPVQLMILPLVGAIAGGNCAVLKPSELAPSTALLLTKLIAQYLDEDCFHVVNGGAGVTQTLLKEKFDYIFYTGSSRVGKIVRAAANEHLTPVTLELGGKSPVFIDENVDLRLAAKRIMWGKCLNAGQTCIAPDYILCSKKVEEKFIVEVSRVVQEFLGAEPFKSPDYCRIINEAHFKRLLSMLRESEIAFGGDFIEEERFISPTIVINPQAHQLVMQQEIFGPILPILNVNTVQEAVDYINSKDHPLAIYVFTSNSAVMKMFNDETSSGSVCINDVISQAIPETLPFGGVGKSGIGAYHGKYSFETFTHKKSCLTRNFSGFLEALWSKRYPPYSEMNLKFLTTVLSLRFKISYKLRHALTFAAGIVFGFQLSFIFF